MTEISYDDLARQVKDVTLVDVRTRDEVVSQGQLPNSHVLPVQELEDALTLTQEDFKEKYGFLQLDTSDENLVITCRSGRRVGIANDILKAKGFTKHKLYRGSFLEWTERGGSVVKPGQPYKSSH